MSGVATKVQPDYPNIARQLKIQGAVELEVEVGESGEVVKVDIVSGNPVLTQSAAQAVKRWKFKPFLEVGAEQSASAGTELDGHASTLRDLVHEMHRMVGAD
jgi:TonB family protein